MAIDREKYIDEIIDAAQYYAEESEQAKFLLEMAKSLEGISDNEFKKWAIINGADIFKYLPDDTDLYKTSASMKEPDSWQNDVPDVEKIFNDDEIALKWKDIPKERIKGLAESNGYTEDQIKQALEEKALIESRKNQMWGTNTLQKIFTPRLYEKRLREGIDADIFSKDFLFDFLENGLYSFNPLGRIGQMGRIGNAVAKSGIAGKVANSLVNAAANPLAMEIADAIAYDDPNNERSEFSLGDLLMGTGTNIGAPLVLKGTASTIGKMLGGMGPTEKVNKWIWNFGKGDKKSVLQEIANNNRKYEEMKDIIQKHGKGRFDEDELKWFEEWGKGYSENNILFDDVFSCKGENLESQFRESYEKNSGKSERQTLQAISKILSDELKKKVPKAEFDEEKFLERLKKDISDNISDLVTKSNYAKMNNKSLKTPDRVRMEQMVEDFITNKYGDVGYDSDKNYSLLGIGSLAKAVKEYETEKKETKAKKEAQKKLSVRSDKFERWQKGFATPEERNSDEYKEWFDANTRKMMGVE